MDPTKDNLTASQISDMPDSVIFEVPLDAVLETLNIFGSGMPVSSSNPSGGGNFGGKRGDDDDESRRTGRTVDLNSGTNNAKLEHYFRPQQELKKTGMKMGYGGPGYPLTFLL